jgi:hypothetical protein
MKDDQETHKDGPFLTNTRGRIPPLVTSKFVVKDDGKGILFVLLVISR